MLHAHDQLALQPTSFGAPRPIWYSPGPMIMVSPPAISGVPLGGNSQKGWLKAQS